MKFEWDFSEFEKFASRLNSSLAGFELAMKDTARKIAIVLLRLMRTNTPIGTSELVNGWNNESQIVVIKRANGFEVKLVNKTNYALYVNDGHESHNQYGGPYEVHKRVKVPTPHKWQQGDGTHWVFGHFFVERSIVQLTNTSNIESIIMQELQKWWERV